jgi:hypothetical protein
MLEESDGASERVDQDNDLVVARRSEEEAWRGVHFGRTFGAGQGDCGNGGECGDAKREAWHDGWRVKLGC